MLAGSGRVKLDDEIETLDAIRVAPRVTREFEAGSDGIELLAFGPRHEGRRADSQLVDRLLAPGEALDLAHLDPALGELRPRGLYVRDHQLQALDRAGRHVREPGPQGDRGGRPGRGQLDEAV